MSSDVNWRDLLPPQFFDQAKYVVTVEARRIEGLQIGDSSQQTIREIHGGQNCIGNVQIAHDESHRTPVDNKL